MRILLLNHNVAWCGGTFYRAYHAGRYLAQRGHCVTLLTISARRRLRFFREVKEGIEIIHTPDLLWGVGRTGWDPWDTLNRIVYLNGQTWDIIHAWDSRPAVILPALHARRQSGKTGGKLVIDWCDWWGRGGTQSERSGILVRLAAPIETYFEEAFRARADGTTVISQALYERALSLKVRAETIRRLPQGCDVKVQSDGNRSAARQRLGVALSRPLILHVGALTRSDAQLLFDSLRLLFHRRRDCQAVLIGRSGARIPDDLKKSAQLVETGFVPETTLTDYMESCDALLVPMADTLASRARWPSRVNPFLAAGRAVVMTCVGDLAALLEREKAALITRCEPEDIVTNVIRLFNNPEIRQQCEIRARHVAEHILAWPLIVSKLEDLYLMLRPERNMLH